MSSPLQRPPLTSPLEWGVTRPHVAHGLAVAAVLVTAFLTFVTYAGTLGVDGMRYADMARGLLEHGEFLVHNHGPNGEYDPEITSLHEEGPVSYSHRYSPLYPAYLAAWFALAGGPSYLSAHLAAFTAYLGALVVVFLCTRDLYGARPAAFTVAFFAVNPTLVLSTAYGYSEAFTLLTYALTIWAILKSLEPGRGRYILLAGLFAGLGYLTRSSIGYFFVAAGIGGLVWRLRHQGARGTFGNRHYLLAAALFASIVAAWALRNLARFWDGTLTDLPAAWPTDAYLGLVTRIAFSRPLELTVALGAKVALFAAFLLVAVAVAPRELAAAWRRRRGERESCLWLAALLPAGIGLVIAAIFSVGEGAPLFWSDNFRYVLPSFIPLLWLTFEAVPKEVARPVPEPVPAVAARIRR